MQKVVLSDDAKSCIPVIRPGIDITKKANMNWACVGDEIGYEIVVTNTGNYDLKGIVLSDICSTYTRPSRSGGWSVQELH